MAYLGPPRLGRPLPLCFEYGVVRDAYAMRGVCDVGDERRPRAATGDLMEPVAAAALIDACRNELNVCGREIEIETKSIEIPSINNWTSHATITRTPELGEPPRGRSASAAPSRSGVQTSSRCQATAAPSRLIDAHHPTDLYRIT